jgi:hypothetical protein
MDLVRLGARIDRPKLWRPRLVPKRPRLSKNVQSLYKTARACPVSAFDALHWSASLKGAAFDLVPCSGSSP